jgi:hypothetical protein
MTEQSATVFSQPVVGESARQADEELQQRAVEAWCEVAQIESEPTGIDTIQLRHKRIVIRLRGVGPGGESIIAKRCRRKSGRVERRVYEQVLPHISVPAPKYYGFLEEPLGKRCWLFLEDLTESGIENYNRANEAQRITAAQWLGTVHAVAAELPAVAGMRDRGLNFYWDHLQSACDRLQPHTDDSSLSADDREFLRETIARLELVARHWNEIEQFYTDQLRTLVHGDFIEKNVRVRAEPSGLAFLVFDWEHAGYGVIGADLAQFVGKSVSPDIQTYATALKGAGRKLDDGVIQRSMEFGSLFWLLVDIHRSSWYFTGGTPEDAMARLKKYRDRLASALATIGWEV